jgi:hypothetical protein
VASDRSCKAKRRVFLFFSSGRARDDLDEIWDYIAADNPAAASHLNRRDPGTCGQMSLHGPVARNRQYHDLATSDKLKGRKSASGPEGRFKR